MAECFAVSASDTSDSFFAATATAIWKSTDGESWSLCANISGVTRIWIDRTQNAVVYAGTSSGAIHRSLDSGVTWSSMGSVGAEVTYLVSDPANYDALYVGAGNCLYYSPDGGQNFVTLNDFGAAVEDASLQAASHISVAINGSPVASRSPDGGQTWVDAAFTPSAPAGFTAITTSPFSPDLSLAAAGSAIWTVSGTNEYEDTYVAQGNASATVNRLLYDLGLFAIAYAATEAGVEKSLDDGATWGLVYDDTAVNDIALGRLGTPVEYVPVYPDAKIWVTQAGGLYLYTNAGQLSSTVTLDDGRVFQLRVGQLGQVGKAVGLVQALVNGTWSWKLWRTEDYGVTNNVYTINGTPDITTDWTARLAVSADFTTLLAGFVAGNQSRLYKSTDGGQNWTQVYYAASGNGYKPHSLLYMSDAWLMGVGGGGSDVQAILKESADGETWNTALSHDPYDAYVSGLTLQANSQIAWAFTSGTAQAPIIYKRTAGEWSIVSNDANNGGILAAVNKDAKLAGYGPTIGNAYSTDGDTWSAATGLTGNIADVVADYVVTGDFLAVTGGTGLYRSQDNGVNWSLLATMPGNGYEIEVSQGSAA